MYTVEVYTRKNGNVLRAKSGFTSQEKAMDWGRITAAKFGNSADYRVFPS